MLLTHRLTHGQTLLTDLPEVVGGVGGGCQEGPGDNTSCLDTQHFTQLRRLV